MIKIEDHPIELNHAKNLKFAPITKHTDLEWSLWKLLKNLIQHKNHIGAIIVAGSLKIRPFPLDIKEYILRWSLINLISITSFALKTDFTIHQRSHSSMNLYPWNPCGSCIIKKLILSITREHTICNHCDKNYIPKLGLNKKLRIHIVENS